MGMHLKKPLLPPLPVEAREEGKAVPRDESWAPSKVGELTEGWCFTALVEAVI